MATPDRAEIGHKLRQHDKEFQSVYELLTQVDGKVDALTERMDTRFGQVDGKIDTLARRLGQVDGKVDALAERLDTRFARVDGKVDTLAERMDDRFREVLDLIRSGQAGG